MKSILPFAVLLFFLANSVQSQTPLSSYIFQNYAGAYTEISGGILLGTEANDDQRFVDPAIPAGGTVTTGPGFPIGFTFNFGGVAFDRLAINNNGWISLGQSGLTPSVNIATTSAYLPISSSISISPSILVSRISALGLDLQGQTGSDLRLETIGAAPSRECVIQWRNYREYGSTGQSYNFQIRLLENGNEIRLMYGSFINNAGYTVQVGLRGEPATTATNYHNRTTTSNWMATIQGGSATANCSFTATVFPAAGTTFVFTPPSGPPGCANLVSPPDLANQVPITASLNWSAGTGGVPDYYKLYFGTDNPPTNPHNGTNVGLATTYDPIPDMNYLTPYFWKIVPVNANGEAQGCPVWSFTTGPDPSIVNFPSCESFDNTSFPPYGWVTMKTAGTGNPGTWDRQTAGTYPVCTPLTGAGMSRYNSYSLAAGTSGILVSPPIDFPSDQYRVSFGMYRDNGYPTYSNELVNVYYSSTPDLSGALLLGTIHRYFGFDPVEPTANQWYPYHFDIPAGAGGNDQYIIFEAVSQYGNNIFLDDVCIEVQPLCPEPTSLTAATTVHEASLGWNSSGVQWEVEYGLAPYSFTGLPSFTTTQNPHLLTGLMDNSNYEYKVRNLCIGGLVSPWSAVYGFRTRCDATPLPYQENFDAVTTPALPPCLTVTNNNGDAIQWKTVNANYQSAPNALNIGYNSTLAMNDWFFSQGLWLEAGQVYELRFSYRAQSATYPESLEVAFGTAPDADSMSGGIIWNQPSIANTTYLQAYAEFSPVASGVYFVGWHGYSAANMYQLYVDDIAIMERKYYLVPEVYDDASLQDGDTVRIIGEYASSRMYSSYLDQKLNQLKPAHSQILLEGTAIPDSADHGGLVAVRGVIRFISHPDPLDETDTLLAILTVTDFQVYIAGWDTASANTPVFNENEVVPEACDPCKFAVLISGGYNHANNPPKYYKELADLYKLKVDHQNYCPENVYVHYYYGKDSLKASQTQIPSGRIFRADVNSIRSSFSAVASKVKQCTNSGKPATFQKMVTNHGDSTGKIIMLKGEPGLKPVDLKQMQQAIIDSCCSTVYDEFIQCYPGYSVDAARSLNNRGKATIYANAPANRSCTWSDIDKGSIYLATKINALKAGQSYPAAVAAAQSAYNDLIKEIRSAKAAWKQELLDDETIPKRDSLLGVATRQLTDLDKGIGKSKNVTVYPMKTYCEWKEFVIPPGGQLVLEFEGDRKNCGNVTVNIVDPVSGVIKEHSFNWNVPGSWRFSPGKEQRVINGHPTLPTTVKVHNDNRGPGFTMTGSANHNTALAQSFSNALEYPGFSFGGSDQSSSEFGAITQSYLMVEHVDQLPFYLNQLPARMGSGGVENFYFTFEINPQDTLWRSMQLQLDVAEVFEPGILKIIPDNSTYGPLSVNITTPGTYTVPLGDMSQMGTMGFMQFSTTDMPAKDLSLASFSFDSWGLYSVIQPVLGDMDLGDAPDPSYPTLINSDGARHLVVPGIQLGALIDGEPDGQPTSQSTGDDLNLPDDEDGVAFLWPITPGNPCKIKVNASVGNALLNAWIDYNGNGSWGDPGEQIFSDLGIWSGDNFLTFIVPMNAVPGLTHARFRFSHQPALSYTGYAFDGEVEDYMVSIIGKAYKWQQLPDLALPGTHAHDNLMAADDFTCTGGQITQIGWWGNYELNAAQQEKRGQGINHFMVNLYTDINCLPFEPPIMSFIIPFALITETNTGLLNNEGCPVYYYVYNLPFPYPQIQGSNYWVSVMAMPNNPVNPAIWRWQEANRWYYPILCGAANRSSILPWQTILFGAPVKSMDLAFQITSVQATAEVDPDPMDSFVQNEISMAIVPGNVPGIPSALVAAYNDEPYPGGPGLGVSHSFDGGATWTAQQLPYPLNPAGTPYLDSFDPAATADGNGNVYVAHISTDYDWTNGQESGFYIHKSSDGGVNWTGPYLISYDSKPVSNPDTNYRFNDRCQIVADINPSSPYYNTIYAVWIKDRGWQNPVPESDIYFSSSSDGGVTWTPMMTINQRIHNLANMPNHAIAPDGTIYICWMDYNVTTGGSGTIYMNKSTNGGLTWMAADHPVISIPLPPLRLNGGTDVLAKGAPVIEASPNNSQELYLVFAQFAGLDEADIVFGKSTDGGQTWILNLKLNDDITVNDQVLPWMAVKPNGTIDIIWYDRRNDPSDLNWDIYMTSSTDGGNSFQPNIKVNTSSAPSPLTPVSGFWMGEYPGLAVDDEYAYIAYTSSLTDTKGDIFFNKFKNPTANIDYGDAPDPGYPTLKAGNGASHIINPLVYMGNTVDPENDGLPNVTATGDDLNNLPDEDGVVFNTALVPGQMASLTIQVSATGMFLQGWIDFNNNGIWADPGEQIITNALTSAGFMSFSFNVPSYAVYGNSYARFRISTQQGLPFFGPAPDGEVEDYRVRIILPMDYGDAPDPSYPTLSSSNGACHLVVPGVMLGNLIDVETDGLPNASATGDNTSNLNDEDGVIFNTPLIPGQFANLTIFSTAGFFVQGWIDFNADGDWMDPGEQILMDAPVIPGPNPFPYFVPLNTSTGSIFARFRLSSMPGLSFSGPAPDGEVEDYRILNIQTGMDFGDAMEPPYSTLLASNGPRHQLIQGIQFGPLIDMETDGQPDPMAMGDDIIYLPDEDGIFISSLVPGQTATVTLLPSAVNLFMQGWIDFNGNGSFTDYGEQIITNLVSTAGPNVVSFTVPPYAMIGQTVSRFRISSIPGLTDIGPAPDGEVEDYLVTIESGQADELDFGDAPDPTYPTLLGSDGARHLLNGVTFLGNQADSEPDGLPDPLALGDDINNLPDEDGIIFNWPLLKGSPAMITVTVSGGGLLNGWIDFDKDGTWIQPGEQVFTDLYLNPGIHQLGFMIPLGAQAGPTFARFRISNQPGLSFNGYAYDGEVEDYLVNINENPELKWQQLPSTSLPGLHSHDYINSLGNYEAVSKADDWLCNGGRITDIHWWGNYETMGLIEKKGAGIAHFRLSIHLDDPTGICLPVDPEVWSAIVPFNSITEHFTGTFNNEGCKIYKYEYVLPVPFDQVAGNRYWLEVNVVSVNPSNPAIWRWQEALRGQAPIFCGATEKIIPIPGFWYTIQWTAPDPDHFSDMAFALTNAPDKSLNLKLYLEGLYKSGGIMSKAQDEYGDHFGADTADLVSIELHNAVSYTTIEYTASNVKIDTNGFVSISGIPYSLDSNYYITGKHRNTIETTTANPVSFSGNVITYDFSIAASQAYGSNQLNLGGVYVFYGGDENQDGIVDSSDMIDIDNDAANFVVGYIATDVNGDGLVDSSDMILVDNNSGNFVTAVLP